MSSPPRLRRGLVLLIAAFGAALALTYAWVVPRLVLDTEDTLFGNQLDRLREQAARPGATDETLAAPGVRVVRDLSGEPRELAEFLRALPVGVHEFYDERLPGLSTTELIVAVEDDGSGAPVRWLLYDLSGLEALEGNVANRRATAAILARTGFEGARGRLALDPRTNNVVQDIHIFETRRRQGGEGIGFEILARIPDVRAEPEACQMG